MSRHAAPRGSRMRLVAAGAVVAAIATVASISLLHGGPSVRAAAFHTPRATPTAAATSSAPSAAPSPPAPRWAAFARAGGVTMYLPVAHPIGAGVFYHEASFHDALRLHPLGHLVRNANHWGFHKLRTTPGPGYTVMSSRGRGTPATSAADVIVGPAEPFRSPVTGTVTAVRPYRLYCAYPDLEVWIRPDGGSPDSVAMIHLRGVKVAPGDRVFATLSVIGFARQFPFRSQVDDYVRGGDPHVHIEITKPHPTRQPAC